MASPPTNKTFILAGKVILAANNCDNLDGVSCNISSFSSVRYCMKLSRSINLFSENKCSSLPVHKPPKISSIEISNVKFVVNPSLWYLKKLNLSLKFSIKETKFLFETITPLGLPVVPDVYIVYNKLSGVVFGRFFP